MARPNSAPKTNKQDADTIITDWKQTANSDQPDPIEKPSGVKSKKITIRMHPDLLAAIARVARDERRKSSDVLRDFVVKGMQATGTAI